MTGLHEVLAGRPIRHEVLRWVHERRAGGINVADLTRALGMAKNGLNAHLNKLEAAGLIRRVRQSSGHKLVTLTPAGVQQLAVLPEAV